MKEAILLSEQMLKSPVLEDMQVLSCLSNLGGVSTYLVKSEITEKKYLFKCLSVPESQTHVEGLKYSGAIKTVGEAQAYYSKVVNGYKIELETLKELAKNHTIACFTNWSIIPKDDAVGFDIHLLASDKQTLSDYLASTAMTQAKAANLGMDLCRSLMDLRSAGYVHSNIKPSNVYLNSKGHFVLGDLGIISLDELKYAAIPERRLGKYTAPELFDVMQYPNTTVDIYSIGLMLYNIYNGGHNPFEDEHTSAKGASEKRISGCRLPAPLFADYEMAEIILKACAFAPADRYQTPEELFGDLDAYVLRNAPEETLIVPPIVADDDLLLSEEAIQEELEPMHFAKADDLEDAFIHHFSPDAEVLNDSIEAIRHEQADAAVPVQPKAVPVAESAPAEEEQAADAEAAECEAEPQKKKLPLWAWISGAAVLLVAVLTAGYFLLAPSVKGYTVIETGADSLTIALDSSRDASAFIAVCKDSYGNRFTATAEGKNLIFTSLSPGTKYSVELRSASFLPMRGTDRFTVSTATATNITSFVVKPLNESAVELSFAIVGRDQQEWTIAYEAEDAERKEVTFFGHEITISDLLPNNNYTFTILSNSAVSLSGKTQVQYDTTIRITVHEIQQEYTETGVILTWTYEGKEPEKWSVLYTLPDGSRKELTTTSPRAEIDGLEAETDYVMEIFTQGMPEAKKTTVRKNVPTIDSFSATAQSNGDVRVTWSSEDSSTDVWRVLVRLKDGSAAQQLITTDKTGVRISGLLPNTVYDISVHPGDGWTVKGTNSARITTAESKPFDLYGCTRSYLGLFQLPSKNDWTANDLNVNKTSFRSSETIAFALEALSTLKKSADPVIVTLAIRTSDGVVMTTQTATHVWDNMWSNKLFLGQIEPGDLDAGSYTMAVYFNSRFVASRDFTIQ